MVRKYLLVALLVTLAGCSSWRKQHSTDAASMAATGSTAPKPPTAQSMKPGWMESIGKAVTPTPAMDPQRKVNEQDCASGGVDLAAGNLRCR